MRRGAIACLASAVLGVFLFSALRSTASPFPSSPGVQILEQALTHLGIDGARATQALRSTSKIAAAHKGFISLEDLADVARAAKLHVYPLRANLESLYYLAQQGQVLTNAACDKHFCLLTAVKDGKVSFYDPHLPETNLSIPYSEFLDRWNGNVVLLSRTALPDEQLAHFVSLPAGMLRSVLAGSYCHLVGNGPGNAGHYLSNGKFVFAAGPSRYSPKTADPVQLGNGDLAVDVTDLSIPARGLPLEFTRYYHSQAVSYIRGWLPISGGGSWVIENGEYSGQGDRVLSDLVVNDVTIDVDIQTVQPGSYFSSTASILWRYQPAVDLIQIKDGYYAQLWTTNQLVLGRIQSGLSNILVKKDVTVAPTAKNHLKIEATGGLIKVSLNGVLQITTTDSSPLPAGQLALDTNTSHAHFDNIVVKQGTTTTTYDFSADDNEFMLGSGWSHTYSTRLFDYSTFIEAVWADGVRQFYLKQPDGTFIPAPIDDRTRLTKDGTGFSLKTKQGLHYRFTTAGRLSFVEDRNLNRTTLTYGTVNGKTVPTTITESAGRALTLAYGANGLLASVTDPLGKKVSYGYDTAGHLTSATDRLAKIESYAYDAVTHNLTRLTDKMGNAHTYAYSYNDRVDYQLDPLGNKTSFTYMPLITQVRNARNEVYSYEFQLTGFLKQIVDPFPAIDRFTFDANANLTSYANSFDTWTFTYDANGNRTAAQNPEGGSTSATYDAALNLPLTITDARGKISRFTYDAKGNLLTATDALGKVTTFTYNTSGQPLTVTNAAAGKTTFAYNTSGDVASVTNPLNQATNYSYDLLSRLSSVSDSIGTAATLAYDAEGRPLTVVDGLSQTTRYAYNANGDRTSVTDPLNNVTSLTYDCFGNVLSVTDPRGKITRATYDNANYLQLARANQLTLTDANGRITSYAYNPVDQITKITDAAGKTTQFNYNDRGFRIERTDALGRITRYTHDTLKRLTQITYPDFTTSRFAYDPAGNLTGATDTGGLTAYSYDDVNRLTQKVYPDATALTYAYDAIGNRTSLGVTGIGSTAYAYDAASRLTQIAAPGNLISLFTYDARSRRATLTLPNGVITNYAYDIADQLSGYTAKKGTTTIDQGTYTYNAGGNRTQHGFTHGPTVGNLTYGYDAAGELLTESGTVAGLAVNAAYTYDPLGNRTQLVNSGVTTGYTYNSLNQLASQTNPAVTFTYDALGNRTKRTAGSLVETLGYDFDNRLSSWTNGTASASYTYNGLGERIKKTVGATTTVFYQDGAEVVLEKTGSTVTFYLHGPGIDELLARKVGSTWSYYHADGLGSVAALTNSAGTLLNSYAYEPFGGIRKQTGTTTNAWDFTGRPRDGESSLQFLRNRYYDSRTGTFLTQDPIGVAGGVNLYTYVGNNPMNLVDPYGFMGRRTQESLDWYAYESALPGPFGAPTSEWQPTYYNWGDLLKYTEAAGGAWMWGERAALGVSASAATVAGAMLTGEVLASRGTFSMSQHVLGQVSQNGSRYWSETIVRQAIRYGPRLSGYGGTTPIWNYFTTFAYPLGGGTVVLNWFTRTIVHYLPK